MTRSIRSPEVVPFLEGLIVMRTVRRQAQPRHAKPFEGRTVVVTGASAGLGRATARAFGANGAQVALLARGRVGLEAARHPRRREYRVGAATAAAVLAHRAAPGLLDRYLARTGHDAQQTDVASAAAPHNLWSPLDGAGGRDHRAHGTFDDEAAAHSPYTALARHPAAVGAAVGTSAFVARVLLGRPGAARRPRAEGR
ncbi:SDR family NAD(P)-dependent oxidoreductase [Streptomyces sp. NPDC051742]|uniref:SDR family NAD(P)-dependent oxidoreductase n=1 Tax=unclassified Streptomyces TaxID=2593676 RepID=UPI003424C27B